MAETKAKRPGVFTQQKVAIYQSLSNLNTAFQTVALELERLDDYVMFTLPLFRQFTAAVQETRAGINHRITEYLNEREESEWAHYGKQRIASEERLKS
jgi:hypothetical protein